MPVEQGAEALVGGDELLRLRFGDTVELGVEASEGGELACEEVGPRLWRELARSAGGLEQLFGRGMVEELALVGRATPAPEQHLLSDDPLRAPPRGTRLLDHIAAAEEQERRLARHLAGTDHRRPCRPAILAGERVRHDDLAELLDEAVVAADVVEALRRRRDEGDLQLRAGRQQLQQLRRQVAGDDGVAGLRALPDQLHAEEILQHTDNERLDGVRIANRLIDRLEILLDLTRLDRVLGEDRPRSLLTRGGLIDLTCNRLLDVGGLRKLLEAQRQLRGILTHADASVGVEEQRLGDRIDDRLRILREGHIDPGRLLNLTHLT